MPGARGKAQGSGNTGGGPPTSVDSATERSHCGTILVACREGASGHNLFFADSATSPRKLLKGMICAMPLEVCLLEIIP